jgi:predicted RecA/RadA family phage recombinase
MAYKGQPVPSTTYQKGYFKVSDGKSVEVSVPADSDLKAGQFAYLDGFLGVITRDVKTAANETAKAILIIEVAEYETDQIDDSKTFAKGDKVYWDNTDKRFTTDTTGIFAGVVTAAKDTNNVIWFVLWPGFVNETSLQVIGDLSDLDTANNQTLVDAINEVVASVDDAQADATEALERIADNVTCAADASADNVRAALIALLDALKTAGLMDSGE